MRKCIKRLVFLLAVVCCFHMGGLLADKQALRDTVIRLHVVGASDSAEDQYAKLQVRDAVLASLRQAMRDATDVEQAKSYMQAHLPQLREVANRVLGEMGSPHTATVTFLEEAFPTRDYETFSLPAGVYDALRITIGDGEGKNWWCVVFPSFCVQPSTDAVEDVAAGAGFSDGLSGAMTGTKPYRIRFYFLELLGKVENFFFGE